MTSHDRRFFSFPMIITVISWGLNFVALKLLYPHMEASAAALSRFLVMYVLLIGVCLLRGESLKYPASLKESFQLLFLGFVSMGVYIILFMEGMVGSSPGEGAILLATSPIFTIFIAAMMKQEKLLWPSVVGAFIAFGGVAVMMLGGHHIGTGKLTSNILVLISAAVWALATTLMRPLVLKFSPLRALTLAMPGGLIVLLPYGISATLATSWLSLNWVDWLAFFHVSAISGVVAFICFYIGVRQIGAPRATLYQYFVPICTMLFQWWILGTALSPMQLIGFAVVIGGVILATVGRAYFFSSETAKAPIEEASAVSEETLSRSG